jgi:hypothetical protein
VAAFVNARSRRRDAFGPQRDVVHPLDQPRDRTDPGSRPEIVVSELDHEANVATWLALERAGARIVWWRPDSAAALNPAISNPLLTSGRGSSPAPSRRTRPARVVDVAECRARAHAVGARSLLDAVHYAPHGSIDVQGFDCDYLVCSGYKSSRRTWGSLVPARGDQSPADVSRGLHSRRDARQARSRHLCV